jgi:hypothetical protein
MVVHMAARFSLKILMIFVLYVPYSELVEPTLYEPEFFNKMA